MVLSGPVAVCVDRPLLALDRPFTYDLPEEFNAGIGSLVQVPFHGKATRGWVLGATEDVPPRMLGVRKVVSEVRFLDPPMLELLRWVSERYVAPLATVIARSHPPRVAGEEVAVVSGGVLAPLASPSPTPLRKDPAAFRGYAHGTELIAALHGGSGSFVIRPAPEDEIAVAVASVATAIEGGRTAILLVPEADPLPATAAAIRDTFGHSVGMFVGGDERERYRMWLDIKANRYSVVVGTRPAVFAPVGNLGLVFVSRESHAQHREERSPRYHVRDVAIARARMAGAACVMSALLPSLEARVGRHVEVARTDRAWPPVEVVKPGPEGRAPRLVAALKTARRAFLFAPLPGYGVARVCRSCREPAACAACGGLLRSREGGVRCAVCGAEGRCGACGASDFGLARGGAERVEEWAGALAAVPVRRIRRDERPRPPGEDEVIVGGVEVVKDFGTVNLDLVGILDADLAARRPGLSARERALASWMEAAAWARPSGRVIVQTDHPNDPAVQALVTGKPDRFARAEIPRLAEAGFPVGGSVFRVAGTDGLETELAQLSPITLLSTELGGETVCLLALDPGNVPTFGRAARSLAGRGIVTRVDAEPHL